MFNIIPELKLIEGNYRTFPYNSGIKFNMYKKFGDHIKLIKNSAIILHIRLNLRIITLNKLNIHESHYTMS